MSSSYHNKFKQFLLNELSIPASCIEEEYPVNLINPEWNSGRHRFDFYIPTWRLVVEIHGEQHYSPATFGGIAKSKAETNYVRQVLSDNDKAYYADLAGFAYLAYSYKDLKSLTPDSFFTAYREAILNIDSNKIKSEETKKSSFSKTETIWNNSSSFNKGNNGFISGQGIKSGGFRRTNNKV
jgi:hypothetical protein